MMRGCQRKVIFLKNTGSSLFDEAYFVISRESEKEDLDENNMIVEANRIIESQGRDDSLKSGESKVKVFVSLSFLLGLFMGIICGVLVTQSFI